MGDFFRFIIVILVLIVFAVKPTYQAKLRIGNWTDHDNEATAGEVSILNDKQIIITRFSYFESGPEAWFTIGLGKNEIIPVQCSNYRSNPIIADDNGSCEQKPGRYYLKDIILTLPEKYSWAEVNYVGMFCYRFQVLFGYIKIPVIDLSTLAKYKGPEISECKTQHEKILGAVTVAKPCGKLP